MRFLLILALLCGCVAKQPPVVLDSAEPVRLALVWDQSGPGDPTGVSGSLAAAVVAELEARNLQVDLVDAADFGPEFARRRATGQRLKWLTEGGGAHVVLLEARTSYYDQINGLYRWTVSFKASMVGAGEDFPVDATFEVPVFLQFHHQEGMEALDAARDVARKRVGRLVDTVLGAGDGSARAGPEPDDDGVQEGPGVDDLGPVYFVMVDRFHNGDPSNDGDPDPTDPQAFHGGDLRGVISKLDHIQGLGIQTLWLSPVFRMRTEPIGEWGAYHGYWPTGEDGVEPRFGTDADLQELSAELHRRGMKLLLDVVLNHVGYDVPLVTEKPAWFHGEGDVVDWGDPVQATRFDVHGLPDLNHENPEVVAWLDERVAGWIDRYEPDGFRLDAVRHVPVAYWRYFNDRVRAVAGDDFVLLGELFEGDPVKLDATWREAGFSHMFDFPLYYALTDVLCGDAHPGRLASMLAQDALYDDPTKLVTFVDNHDLPRVSSTCWSATEAVGVLSLLRGQPALYQGTEFDMTGRDEPDNRASVPWDRTANRAIAHALATRATLDLGRGRAEVARLQGTDLAIVVRRGSGGAVLAIGGPPARRTVSYRADLALDALEPPRDGRLAISAEGEHVRLVGAGDLLGRWNPDSGLSGRHAGGRTVFQFDVPGGAVLEYKLVRRDAEASWEWEPSPNRYLFVDGDASVELSWGQ